MAKEKERRRSQEVLKEQQRLAEAKQLTRGRRNSVKESAVKSVETSRDKFSSSEFPPEKRKERVQRSASEDLALIILRLAKNEGSARLLNPLSENMKRWDIWCGILLIYTAYMTPVEVAFMDTEIESTTGMSLFIWNRIIDLSFLADIFKCFVTKYVDENGSLVQDGGKIRYMYFKGWFFLDLAAILPFDTMGIALNDPAFAELKIVRVVRLLRLLKLVKLTRGLKFLERWQNQVSIDFGILSLAKMFLMVLTMAHWVACLFRLLPDIVNPGATSWLTEKTNDDELTIKESSLSVQYGTAVYWATYTLATIGYGDIPIPSDAERGFATLVMFVGGGVYAYVVGGICSIIASFGELGAQFQQNLDLLNKYMALNCVPQKARVELREYFRYSRHLAEYDRYHDLLLKMSPKLQAKITVIIYGRQVQRLLDSIMPCVGIPPPDTGLPGVIVAANSNGSFAVQMDHLEDGVIDEEVTSTHIFLQTAVDPIASNGKVDPAASVDKVRDTPTAL
jgi:hypothetical protein